MAKNTNKSKEGKAVIDGITLDIERHGGMPLNRFVFAYRGHLKNPKQAWELLQKLRKDVATKGTEIPDGAGKANAGETN